MSEAFIPEVDGPSLAFRMASAGCRLRVAIESEAGISRRQLGRISMLWSMVVGTLLVACWFADSRGALRAESREASRAAGGRATGSPQEQAQGSEADSKAIKEVFAEFYEAFSRHDAHAACMTFAEDADFTNMGGVHSHGRKEVEERLARLFAGNLKAARRTDIVKSIRLVTPEIAEVDADTIITGTLRADGSEVPPRKGLMVTTMTKQNGRWYISIFHEVEFPPAAAAPAPAR